MYECQGDPLYTMVFIWMLPWQHAWFQSPAFPKLNTIICDSTRQTTWCYQRRMYGGAFWTKMQSNRHLHSTGSYFHSIGSYLSSIRSYFNYFVASYCPECPSIRMPVSPSIGSPLQRFCIFRSVQLQMVIFDFEEERDWNRVCYHSNIKIYFVGCNIHAKFQQHCLIIGGDILNFVSHHSTCTTEDVISDLICITIGKLEYLWNKRYQKEKHHFTLL